jgi:hypothetical protein
MELINQQLLTGERALFKGEKLKITNSVFQEGESPLKESRDIILKHDIFRWKYPLWYAKHITAQDITLVETARSGIWYTHHLLVEDSTIQVPKTFRRSSDIKLVNVQLPNAQETFWNCNDIELKNVSANGDYFAMNSTDIHITDFSLTGNYGFDGCKNVEITNAKLISKDAFWNCENVVVKDSTIIGEYLGWNSKNVTFINCIIESEQGLCYMDNVELIDCTVIHTDLAFEYSTVQATINSTIDSVKNPYGGKIISRGIDELIIDDVDIDIDNTVFIQEGVTEHAV